MEENLTIAHAFYVAVLVLGFIAVLTNALVGMREYSVWWQLNRDKRVVDWLRHPSTRRRSRITLVILSLWMVLLVVSSFWIF